ncbi:hypothetical protein EV08_1457 [Prochlorococcus marinus str. SS2]|nr:hypothetical protein EV08_1457 [Prochlorococcus marinus str. SS2]
MLAPIGQLCGNGQLRETISERRNKRGQDVAFWYLSADLVKRLNIASTEFEAVVAADKTAIDWLKLRFGGELSIMDIDLEILKQDAMDLPPAAPIKDISIPD